MLSFTIQNDIVDLSQVVVVHASAAVRSWSPIVLHGANFLVVAQSARNVTVAVTSSAVCNTFGSGYLQPAELHGLIQVVAALPFGEWFAVEVPVHVKVQSPEVVMEPQSLYSLLRRSSSLQPISAEIKVTNHGNVPLVGSLSLSDPSGLFTVTTTDAELFVAPGATDQAIRLDAVFTGNVPDTYAIVVEVPTNIARCDGSQHKVKVPWAVQVTDLLFVPQLQYATLSPDQSEGVGVTFSLANFAGFAVLCNFSMVPSQPEFENATQVSPPKDVLPAGQLLPVQMTLLHPLTPLPVHFGAVIVITAQCSSQSDGSALGISRSVLQLAVTHGTPYAPFCSAVLASSSIVAIGGFVTLDVVLRDRAGSVLQDQTIASQFVSLQFTDHVRPESKALLSFPSLTSRNGSVSEQTYFELVTSIGFGNGSYTMSLAVLGKVILQKELKVLEPQCPEHLVADLERLGSCVCPAGHFYDTAMDSCVACLAGTYKRSAGNTSASSCIACPVGWYCVAGSELPTGPCSVPGYSCDGGILTVSPGYSVLNLPSALSKDITDRLPPPTRCALMRACPASNGACAQGYNGLGCQQCADGYTPFQNHCIQCSSTVTGVIVLLVWIAVVIGCVAVAVTLQFEERGAPLKRIAWVGTHGQAAVSVLQLLHLLLCLCALQLLIPSQIPEAHVTALLSVVGAAVTPGIWTPTMCVIHDRTSALLLPILLLLPISIVSTGVSILLAPVIWRKSLITRRSAVLRFWMVVRCLISAFYPSILWKVASHHRANSGRVASTALILPTVTWYVSP
jgi:hypothetical protein